MKKGDIRKRYSPEFKQDALELAEKNWCFQCCQKTGHFFELSSKMEVSKEHSHRKIPRCLKTSKGSQTA